MPHRNFNASKLLLKHSKKGSEKSQLLSDEWNIFQTKIKLRMNKMNWERCTTIVELHQQICGNVSTKPKMKTTNFSCTIRNILLLTYMKME